MSYHSDLDLMLQEMTKLGREVALRNPAPKGRQPKKTKAEIEDGLINAYHEDWFDQYADSIEIRAKDVL